MPTETFQFVYSVNPIGASGNWRINATGTSTSGGVTFSDPDNTMQAGNTFSYNSGTYSFSGTGTSGGFFATSGGTTYYFSHSSIAASSNIGSINTSGTELVTCFLAGTAIATPDGDRAIETLAPGDGILAADGRVLKVKFVSQQTISPLFNSAPRARPVRIARGALGENRPARDLLVSPGHAIFMDGILVRAGALVNGTTITQAAMEKSFVYYNIECDDQELIVAEGLACESFLDEAPRRVFDNYGDYLARYGEGSEMKALDLPLATTARHLPDLVAERLGLLGERQAA